MKRILFFIILAAAFSRAAAQELYVQTEPASNMATGSIGVRLNTRVFRMMHDNSYALRLDPEVMVGISRKLMLHLNAYASNMYQQNIKPEGAGVYGKYRFFSNDDVQRHFRMAAFGKVSLIGNPPALHEGTVTYTSDDIDLDGNNSGFSGGVIATQLLHKIALSSSVSFLERWQNTGRDDLPPGQSCQAFNYSLSGGYLLLPRVYENFKQTNVNLYCEFIGSSAVDKKAYYIDMAPAVQFIFNSISRLDLSYRLQVAGNMERLSRNVFLLRFEVNFLNAFKQ